MTIAIDIPMTVPAAAKVAQVQCAHCMLPVPKGLIEAGEERQFCCHGCRTVYDMIHQCKLDRYYALRDEDNDTRQPAAATGKAYREFDDETFLNVHARALPDGLRSIEFYLEGVHCAACVWLVEKLPTLSTGVLEARLDLGKALVRIVWDPKRVHLSRIAQLTDSLGYPPHPARGTTARKMRTQEERRHLIRIGVAGAVAGNVMLLGSALYAGVFGHMENSYTQLFRWISMALGIFSLAWPGSVFFRGAWAAIKTRTAHLDLPIALGIGAGGIAGLINTILNRGEIYFDSLTVLVFLLLVGRWLQYRQQGSANDSLGLLFSLTPMSARRVEGDALCEVPVAALKIGDIVAVLAGESVPVDGTVIQGRSAVDQSLLTGETQPRTIGEGDFAAAGTINVSAPLRILVQATGEETRVGKLMRLVTECSRRKAPIVLFADRIGGYFLAAVLALSLTTFCWWVFRSPARAIDQAVAILIVACPCALGLATPLAVAVSIGRAAKRQILIKGGDTLERLSQPGTIFLDKTGTITVGRTALIHWFGPESIKPMVAVLESHSTHPIAKAFCRAFGTPDDTIAVRHVAQRMEGGIGGSIDGHIMLIGSPTYVQTQSVSITGPLAQHMAECLAEGLTPVVVAIDGHAVAVAAFGDAIRVDARESLDTLRKNGWHIGILSGDHPEVVRRVAASLGIPEADARGGLLPEEKLAIVQERIARDGKAPVVMVGDGVNDAAALAAASVGIAVHGGAEASLAAAQVYLARPGLEPIVELINASGRTMRVIHRSLIASLSYNAFTVTLAALGLITPLVAAILMPISSLTVLSLALATRTFGDKKCP
jgi:P-type Cu2+ transporter